MKTYKISLALLLTALLLSACVPSLQNTVVGSNVVVSEARAVSDLRAVKMSGFGRLIITQGDEVSLTVEAEDNLLPYLVTRMRGDTLIIRQKPLFSFRSNQPILFHLTVRSLEDLDLNGFAEVEIHGMRAEKLTVRMGEFSRLALNNLEARNFEAHLSGFAEMDASGIVQQAAVEMRESARYLDSGLSVR